MAKDNRLPETRRIAKELGISTAKKELEQLRKECFMEIYKRYDSDLVERFGLQDVEIGDDHELIKWYNEQEDSPEAEEIMAWIEEEESGGEDPGAEDDPGSKSGNGKKKKKKAEAKNGNGKKTTSKTKTKTGAKAKAATAKAKKKAEAKNGNDKKKSTKPVGKRKSKNGPFVYETVANVIASAKNGLAMDKIFEKVYKVHSDRRENSLKKTLSLLIPSGLKKKGYDVQKDEKGNFFIKEK